MLLSQGPLAGYPQRTGNAFESGTGSWLPTADRYRYYPLARVLVAGYLHSRWVSTLEQGYRQLVTHSRQVVPLSHGAGSWLSTADR
jgi:hypothetical protein